MNVDALHKASAPRQKEKPLQLTKLGCVPSIFSMFSPWLVILLLAGNSAGQLWRAAI
jgi:hypothetical protein